MANIIENRCPEILEVAILDVKPGLTDEFEAAFYIASRIIASMSGYLWHELHRCLETPKSLCSTRALATVGRPYRWLSPVAQISRVAFFATSLLRAVSHSGAL